MVIGQSGYQGLGVSPTASKKGTEMTDRSAAEVAEPLNETVRRRRQHQDARPKRQPPYNVVLWND
ncbi:unnamed protein product, partial [marine sediment metagenome]